MRTIHPVSPVSILYICLIHRRHQAKWTVFMPCNYFLRQIHCKWYLITWTVQQPLRFSSAVLHVCKRQNCSIAFDSLSHGILLDSHNIPSIAGHALYRAVLCNQLIFIRTLILVVYDARGFPRGAVALSWRRMEWFSSGFWQQNYREITQLKYLFRGAKCVELQMKLPS